MNYKKYNTDACEIWLDENGFVRCDISKDLDLKDMEEAYAVFYELGLGPGRQKGLQILTGSKPYTLTKAARDYAGKHGRDYFKAAALVTNSFFMKYVLNVFNSLHNKEQDTPFKAFSSVEEAAGWLKKFK